LAKARLSDIPVWIIPRAVPTRTPHVGKIARTERTINTTSGDFAHPTS
jgi:hypothetical protein